MTYSLTIYITNNCFFFTWKKGAGTPYRRVPSQKKPCLGLTHREYPQTNWNNRKVPACGRPQGLLSSPSVCRCPHLIKPLFADVLYGRRLQWRAEAVGCPGPTRFLDALENILYSSRKISHDHFLVVHLNSYLFSHQLSNFTRIRSLYAPSAASWPGNDIFKLLFGHLPTFLKKTGPLDPPHTTYPLPSH